MIKKYIYTGITAIMMALIVSIVYLIYSKRNMERQWKAAVQNVKAYSDQFDSSREQNRVFKLTIDQLKDSRDSIFQELNAVRKELNVKDSKLKGIQYIASDFTKTDTVIVSPDTIFRESTLDIDTLLMDDWYSLRIRLTYPSTVIVRPEFKSAKYIVVSAKRETVNPPKKFFLFRWFQKKHTVLNIEVVEKNPYMQNQNSRFVEIIR